MKILLGIVVLFFLLSGNIYAVNLPKDVASGNKYFKSLSKNFKKHGMQVVDKKDGHPVRAGDKSIRFEVRPGDCGYNDGWSDCKKDRERHELSGKRISSGEWWHAWSIFLPEDFINVSPAKVALGQFHQEKGHVVWMFQNQSDYTRGGYWFDNQVPGYTKSLDRLLTNENMIGKWNDILVNVKWSKKDNGFFKVWVNNKLIHEYMGPTKTKSKVYFKFGIYRSYLKRWIYSPRNKNKEKGVPTQVVYFDEVRTGKTKDKVVGKLPPLN